MLNPSRDKEGRQRGVTTFQVIAFLRVTQKSKLERGDPSSHARTPPFCLREMHAMYTVRRAAGGVGRRRYLSLLSRALARYCRLAKLKMPFERSHAFGERRQLVPDRHLELVQIFRDLIFFPHKISRGEAAEGRGNRRVTGSHGHHYSKKESSRGVMAPNWDKPNSRVRRKDRGQGGRGTCAYSQHKQCSFFHF